jgi:tRNA (guanosine-2'-O-)-methyltransferase
MKPLGPTDLKRLHRTWRRRTDQALAVVLDGVQQPFNVGGILRSSAAYGVADVWLVPPSADPASHKVQITAKGCDRFLTIHRASTGAAAVAQARQAGYTTVAIELTADAEPLFDLHLGGGPIAIVLGHEDRGIHHDTLAAVDHVAYLPLAGAVGSLNVAHCATSALAELRRQHWSRSGPPGR